MNPQRLSIVVEFPEHVDLPRFAANTDVLGGRVIAVAFGDKLIEPESAQTDVSKLLAGLSPREAQVLTKISEGQKVERIASALGISTKTVNSYRYRIFEHLNVENDVQAALVFINGKAQGN